MPKRTLAVLAAAAFGALAVPFGLPTVAHATGPTYASIAIKPLPLEQAGQLLPTGTNSVTACVQPLSSTKTPVVGASVFLSIDNGLFTAPPTTTTGTAFVGATQLTSTPTAFTVQATCTWVNEEGTGTLTDAVPVIYTGPNPTLVHGRDVIAAESNATSFDATTGLCLTTAGIICNTGTYVFSPVMAYQVTSSPKIAPDGTLTAGQTQTVTITALDNSTPAQPVPGAFIDISLSSAASGGGTATAVNNFSGFTNARVNNAPNRFGADNVDGQVVVTYKAADPLPATGIDTLTIQNTPTHATVTASTSYTYAAPPGFAQAPYTAVTPFRVCDTRPLGHGITANQCDTDSTGAGSGPILQKATRVITVGTYGGVPGSGVTAVVLNVTAVAPTQGTFLTLFPDGGSLPATSNVNPPAGAVVANLVEVAVSTAGKVDVYNALGTTNVVLDIEGYVSSGSTGKYNPTAPTRICDTRAVGAGVASNPCNDTGAGPHPIGPGDILNFNVASLGSPVPTSGVSAVVFNLTAISPSIGTVLTAYPGPLASARPTASNINIPTGRAVPNRVIVPVGCSAGICSVNIWNSVGFVNVAVDIDGWFGAGGGQFTAIPPARVCDSRSGNVNVDGCEADVIASGQVLNINVTGVDGIATLVGSHTPIAIVANVTAVNASTGTYVTVFPGPSTTPPTASDLNVPGGATETNLVVVEVGSDGTISLFNALGNVNLIVDVLGYYSI